MLWAGTFQYRIITTGGKTAIAASTIQPVREVSCASSPAAHTQHTQTAAHIAFLYCRFIIAL
jgi:hypothetical protein